MGIHEHMVFVQHYIEVSVYIYMCVYDTISTWRVHHFYILGERTFDEWGSSSFHHMWITTPWELSSLIYSICGKFTHLSFINVEFLIIKKKEEAGFQLWQIFNKIFPIHLRNCYSFLKNNFFFPFLMYKKISEIICKKVALKIFFFLFLKENI